MTTQIINDEEMTAFYELWANQTPVTLPELDAAIVADQQKRITCLERDLKAATNLHHNYRQFIRQLLNDHHIKLEQRNAIELLRTAFGDQHPGFPLSTWKWDVKHDQTEEGYWEWLYAELKKEAS